LECSHESATAQVHVQGRVAKRKPDFLLATCLDGGAVLRREVGQESWCSVETLGGIAPPTKHSSSTCSALRQGSAGHQYGPDGVRTGRRRRAPPPLSSTTRSRISMAAVAGDAENINKQARNTRADWDNSPGWACQMGQRRQEQASGRRPLILGPSGGRPRRLALCGRAPPPFTYGCRIMFM